MDSFINYEIIGFHNSSNRAASYACYPLRMHKACHGLLLFSNKIIQRASILCGSLL